MKQKIIFLSFGLSLFSSCFLGGPALTPEELRERQSRVYDGAQLTHVTKALLNAFQDQDYMVRSANPDIGLIFASKERDLGSWGSVWNTEENKDERWEKTEITECTANVSELRKQIDVRLTCQRKKIDNKGDIMSVDRIQSEKFYFKFFDQLDRALLIVDEHHAP